MNPEYKNLTKIPYFRRVVLQNFPFIEEDFDALTDYGFLCKVVEYLNKVIEQQNLVNDNTDALYQAYTTLKNYVDNYFDNLDVQDEINNKLDEFATDGTLEAIFANYITPFMNSLTNNVNLRLANQDSEIELIDNKVSALVSSAPIPVSNTSGMTDTSKIYVNTTDGKWYYYNGSAWVIGGTYQSTGIGNNSITSEMLQNKCVIPEKTDFNFSRTSQLFNKNNYNYVNKIWNENTGIFQESQYSYSLYIPITGGNTYYVQKNKGSRIALCTTELIPTDANVIALNSAGDNNPTTNKKLSITAPENANYLCVFFYNVNGDSGITREEVADTIMINTGSDYISYQDYYELIIDGNYIKNNTINKDKLNFECPDLDILIKNNNLLNYFKTYNYLGYSYNTSTGVIRYNINNNFKTVIIPITNKGIIRISKNLTINTNCQMFILDSNKKVLKNYNELDLLSINTFPNFINWDVFKFTVYENYIDFNNEFIYKNGGRYLWFTFNTSQFYSNYINYLSTSTPSIFNYQENLYTCVNMFENIASVGDSFTEGSIVNSNNQWVSYPNISYIATMGNRAGIPWFNYGKGGSTTKSYQTSTEFNKLLTDEARKMYFISFGINDANQNMNVGTVDDINDSDYTQNADTFYGNYGALIQRIINHAPNSKLILIKPMREGSQYTNYSDAVDIIGNHYNIPVINPFNDVFFQSQFFKNYQSSNHPTAMGYAGMGLAIERLFSKCVFENPNYFKFSNE